MAKKDTVRERRRGMHMYTTTRPSQFTLRTRHSATSNDAMFIQPTVSVPAHTSTGHVHMYGYHNHGHRVSGDDAGSLYALPSYDRISIRDRDGDIITGGERGDYYRPHHHNDRSQQQQREPRERYREPVEGEGDSEVEGGFKFSHDTGTVMVMQPNRRTNDGDVELGGVVPLSRSELARYNRTARGAHFNHMMHNWRSPIGKSRFIVEISYGADLFLQIWERFLLHSARLAIVVHSYFHSTHSCISNILARIYWDLLGDFGFFSD